MPYDPELAARVRVALAARRDVTEKRMFGGVAFLVGGRMACGIVGKRLMARLDPARAEALLSTPHVRPMDFTGRPLRGFVYVEAAGIRTRARLDGWLRQVVAHALAEPKPRGARVKRRRSPRRQTAARS